MRHHVRPAARYLFPEAQEPPLMNVKFSTRIFKSVALIGRHAAPHDPGALASLGGFLHSRGIAATVETETARGWKIDGLPVATWEQLGSRCDLAVVVGGDGCMLAAARQLVAYGVPLVGVNQGRLGFMTDIAASVMLDVLAQVLDGHYSVEERTMLAAKVVRGRETVFSTLALNDVVVNKGAVGRLIEFLVDIDGEFVYDLRSDGLIVATPTGSTAYALSSNGPILQPPVPGFALVPICPHTLSNRPIIISDRSSIEVSLKRAVDARLHFDGQPQCDLHEGDRVLVRRAERTATFLHPPGYSYFAMLREKLHWSEMY